jgi:hypothetical protein
VLGKVLRGEQKLLLRGGISRIVTFIIEGVDGQLTIHHDGLIVFVAVEYQPPAEPPHARLASVMQNGVAPNGYDTPGNLRFRFRVHPRQVIAQFDLHASAK